MSCAYIEQITAQGDPAHLQAYSAGHLQAYSAGGVPNGRVRCRILFFRYWKLVQLEMEGGSSPETGLISLKGSYFFFPQLLWRTGYKVGMPVL